MFAHVLEDVLGVEQKKRRAWGVLHGLFSTFFFNLETMTKNTVSREKQRHERRRSGPKRKEKERETRRSDSP